MSWYEISDAIGLESFNAQGNKPIELIARLTGMTGSSSVLIVGCGSGGTAIHLAEITGASVCGIDLSEGSIRTAGAAAAKSPACGRLSFRAGDASALPFPPASFDVIVTEYMAFFLRPDAFKGFFSVLKPGGYIAMAEPMKDPGVTARADEKIRGAEEIYSGLTGFQLRIPTTDEYMTWLKQAGFSEVRIAQKFSEPGLREKIRSVGGLRSLLRITAATMRLMRESPVLRSKFLLAGRFKRVIIQSRSTARFIFQAVATGRKGAG